VNAELLQPEMPKSIGLLTNNDILFGSPIPAIDKLKIVSPDEYEDIIREWVAGYCQKKYVGVRKVGGANDKGRDVVAFINAKGDYDNYQCKHYNHPLAPSDIWKELGKLCYYTFDGSYKLPQNYFFVAPHGVGPKLNEYLQKPIELKAALIKEWDGKCKTGITDKVEIELSNELLAHINSIDFLIFKFLDPQEFIEQHQQTNYFAARFGGGLKKREKPVVSGMKDAELLLRYVTQLFEAYSDHLKTNVQSITELNLHTELFEHFNRQRECFYWADALNQFSRDSLPSGNTCFEDLKEEIYHGIIDTTNSTHSSGYENVKKTTNVACQLNIQSNALISVSKTQDKIGICHHLSNENKLTWVKK
jgi:hypothetical protein